VRISISIAPLNLLRTIVHLYRSGPKLPPGTDAIIEDVLRSELPPVVTGQTGFASSDGLRIWYESIPPQGPSRGTVLLIMANGGNALDWPPAFVRALVHAGYGVIRYDHRDTGLSDRVKSKTNPPYTLADMAGDAVAVLDALEVPRAHVIGLSMGGMIAQEVAIDHPGRVATLTLIMTSGYIGDPDLPGPSSRFFLTSMLRGLPLLRYRILGGEANLIRERIAKMVAAGTAGEMNVQETAEVALYDLRERRGVSIQGALHHQAAVSHAGGRHDRLGRVMAPALVIHGTADPLIPVEHGLKLVEIMPRAQGLWLDGVGHTFPVPEMDSVCERIVEHMEGE
jgi:pimeloyl-ACP methyl ester carboxylesterase